jgi:hypothetical protein
MLSKAYGYAPAKGSGEQILEPRQPLLSRAQMNIQDVRSNGGVTANATHAA